MDFFGSIPRPPRAEPVRRPRPVWIRPDSVLPGSVAMDVMLVRNDLVAVTVGLVRAYPTGFEFTVHIRLRHQADAGGLSGDPFGRRFTRPGTLPDDAEETFLRVGVQYADGRRAASTGLHPHLRDFSDPDDLVMTMGRAGGGGRTYDAEFWVYPLPPEGPVVFVASWLGYGVTEVRAEIDGRTIREAVARSVQLWPEEDDGL